MRLPKRKGNPKLPPLPRGGGAAARQKQFEQERGMPPQVPLSGGKGDRTDCEEDKGKDDKDNKDK